MTTTGREIRSWRWLALPASIVLNLFFIALIGGHLWQNRSDDGTSGTALSRSLARAEAVLPRQDATAFGAVIRRDAPRYAEAAQRLAEARQEFWREVTAEQFNPDHARQALDAWRAAWNRFLDDFTNTIVAALAEVSPEGRRKLTAQRRSLIAGAKISGPTRE